MEKYRKILKTGQENKTKSPCRMQWLRVSQVLGEGLEPSRPGGHRILSPVRLPIPPSEQGYKISYNFNSRKIFFNFGIVLIVSLLNILLNYNNVQNVY